MINPEFMSNNVQYAISIGEFGNPDYDLVVNSSDRSLPSMPIYDSTKFYAMPWGTHKPVCEVQCSWENILPRIFQSNAIFRVCKMLKEFREEAEARSANNTEVGALISVVLNAIDETLCALHWIETSASYEKIRDDDMILTQLDHHLQQNRFVQFSSMREKLEIFKYSAMEVSKMEEPGIQKLMACAKELEELIIDAQISIPNVIVWMLVDREAVAFAKIPVSEITFSTNEMRSGIDCGKLKTIYFKWIKQKSNNRKLM
uniref:Ferlin B-domain domain-containing protein n=1 Tax=Panagrolaimus sp. ES5 TaxID=591445 RepID=A0AC34GFB0_9BILA